LATAVVKVQLPAKSKFNLLATKNEQQQKLKKKQRKTNTVKKKNKEKPLANTVVNAYRAKGAGEKERGREASGKERQSLHIDCSLLCGKIKNSKRIRQTTMTTKTMKEPKTSHVMAGVCSSGEGELQE